MLFYKTLFLFLLLLFYQLELDYPFLADPFRQIKEFPLNGLLTFFLAFSLNAKQNPCHFELLIQSRLDPYFYVCYASFYPYNLNAASKNQDSSNRTTFFQSSTVQCLWSLTISLVLISVTARKYFFLTAMARLLQSSTICSKMSFCISNRYKKWLAELQLPFYQLRGYSDGM